MNKKFKRQDTNRYSKLGKNRKKLQKWRKPKGLHSKMREKRKSYPASPTIGLKSPKSKSGKIQNLTPVVVYNVKDVRKLSKDQIAIIAKIGARKRLEIIKVAQEHKIKILNLSEAKNETGN